MGCISSVDMKTEGKNNVLGTSKFKSLMTSCMNAIKFRKKSSERYCSVEESIKTSLEEVKLHREGKKQLDTWEEYLRKKNGK